MGYAVRVQGQEELKRFERRVIELEEQLRAKEREISDFSIKIQISG